MPDETNDCRFSIIIPVLNEQNQINSVLAHLEKLNCRDLAEVIVVDGNPQGQTINTIDDNSVIKLISKKGRAVQMNAGAKIARGQIIIFLHADTRLPESALEKIDDCLQNQKYVGGAFSLHIDSDRAWLKYISASTSARSQKSRIPYGDQAIFIRKSCFDEIGKFKEIPLMEDIDLMTRIKKAGRKICILPDKVITSPRRWQRDGLLYTSFRNRIFVLLYNLGVSPEKLAKYYWKEKRNDRAV